MKKNSQSVLVALMVLLAQVACKPEQDNSKKSSETALHKDSSVNHSEINKGRGEEGGDLLALLMSDDDEKSSEELVKSLKKEVKKIYDILARTRRNQPREKKSILKKEILPRYRGILERTEVSENTKKIANLILKHFSPKFHQMEDLEVSGDSQLEHNILNPALNAAIEEMIKKGAIEIATEALHQTARETSEPMLRWAGMMTLKRY